MRTSYKLIHKLTVISACVAFYTVCSWISVPFFINFSLQIFAVFFIASLFPISISALSVISYLAIGLLGLPVFSGFNSGASALFGPSGGFLIGFLLSAFFISALTAKLRRGSILHLLVLCGALAICYLAAVVWYMLVYKNGLGSSLWEALTICLFPYLIPDVLKILLVALLSKKLDPYTKKLLQKI